MAITKIPEEQRAYNTLHKISCGQRANGKKHFMASMPHTHPIQYPMFLTQAIVSGALGFEHTGPLLSFALSHAATSAMLLPFPLPLLLLLLHTTLDLQRFPTYLVWNEYTRYQGD